MRKASHFEFETPAIRCVVNWQANLTRSICKKAAVIWPQPPLLDYLDINSALYSFYKPSL